MSKTKMSTSTLVTWILSIVIILSAAVFITVIKLPERPVTYDNLNYEEYITVPEYKGLKVTLDKPKVTKEEIDQEVQSFVDSKATSKEETEGTVKKGDKVKIDYTGTIDGEKFLGGSAEDYELEIGSGTMVDGFEEGLIGKKVGDKTKLKVTFPEDYQNNMVAGQEANFDVKIKSKIIPITYKYNDEFVKKFTKYDNKKDYEASIEKKLMKQKKEDAVSGAKEDLWTQVVDGSKIKDYPKRQYEAEEKKVISDSKTMAENYNVDWETYLSDYLGQTEKQFTEQCKKDARDNVKEKLIAHDIAQKEKINVSTDDSVKWLKGKLKESDISVDDFEKQTDMTLKKYVKANDIQSQVIFEKVKDLIYDNAKKK